ncbi:flagellar hook-associated protein 3 [Burkholderiales bacterium JOSHI_001]|nr:flagellar hook-associated protein 3 [Burkholderiales bacterium JOSHI_001]
MLRISTHLAYSTGVDTLQKRQRDMSDAQARLTSGKRVEKASDDPTSAARAERAMAAAARADANQRALDASRNNMVQAEAALGDADELMQQAREMILSAGNASFDDSQRNAVVQRLAGLRAQLLQVANRGDGTGGFLFGQQDPVTPPFADVAGSVQSTAPSQLRYTASDEALPLNRDGNATWMSAPSGNGIFETRAVTAGGGAFVDAGRASQGTPTTSTYDVRFTVSGGTTTYDLFKDGVPTATGQSWASGQSIELEPGSGLAFTVSGKPVDGETFQAVPSQPTLNVFDALDRAIGVLGTANVANAPATQAVQFALRDLDSVAITMGAQRADAGAWLARLDNTESRLGGQKLQAQTDRSSAEDLDMVQAVSDFKTKQSSYDAALQTYSMVQRMSLFQYLNP